MQLKPIYFSLSLLLSTTSLAADFDEKEIPNVTQTCIVENSTGFIWQDGQWTKSNFDFPKYTITKVEFPHSPPIEEKFKNCTSQYLAYKYLSSQECCDYHGQEAIYKEYLTCVMAENVDKQVNRNDSDYFCLETHLMDIMHQRWNVLFKCNLDISTYFNFTPDGGFVIADLIDPTDINGYSDGNTQILYTGKCHGNH
jgi:hypothetical protein